MLDGPVTNEPTLHLHIGLHKTGSTSLQSFLMHNRATLARHGVLYPTVGRAAGPSHVNLLRELAADERFDPDRGTWSDVLMGAGTDVRRIIISSEGLSLLEPDTVKELRRRLDGRPVQVIVYLRPQEVRLWSIYVQRVRDGRTFEPFPEFLMRHRDERWFRYHDLLTPWATIFGTERVRVQVVDRERLIGGSLSTDLLAAIGEEHLASICTTVPRRNVSPDEFSVEIIRRVGQRRAAEGRFERQSFARAVGRRLGEAMTGPPGTPTWVTSESALEFRSRFTEQNRLVATEYLGREDGELFAPVNSAFTVTADRAESRSLMDENHELVAMLDRVADELDRS